WFHLAMRLTVMQQTAKGLPQTIQDEEATYTLRDPVVYQLERLKWALWHGNVYKAFHKIAALAMDLDEAVAPPAMRPHLHSSKPPRISTALLSAMATASPTTASAIARTNVSEQAWWSPRATRSSAGAYV